MLKCIDLLIDKNNIFKNSANYLMTTLTALSISSIFVFIFYDRIKIKNYINLISAENNLNNNSNNKNLNKKIENNKINKKKKRKKKINKNIINNPVKKIKAIKLIQNKLKRGNKSKKNSNILKMNRDSIKSEKININLNQDSLFKEKNNTNNNFNSIALEEKKSYNDKELNSLDYEEAFENDKRTFIQYYLSLLRTKHILIFTFCQFRDYNSQIIKIYIFFLTFTINFAVSAMFYSDSTMHKIYEDAGSFDFTYQLPQMFYSLIISTILKGLLNFLGLYESNILEIKNSKSLSKKNIGEYFKIRCKIIFFFVISYIILFFSWIYLGCFCAVYKNTQIHLIIDVASSFGISFISPFFINLLPGIFRIWSLKNKKILRPRLFKFSKFLQLF